MPNGNNTAYPEVAQDPTFVPGWVPRAMPAPGTVPRAQPVAPRQPDALYQSLTQIRQPFIQELSDPSMRQRFIANINAETGDQSPAARQAYIESVMNRAAASNKSIWDTINDPYDPKTGKGYYPPSTMDKLNRTFTPDQAKPYNTLIDQALGGSNTTNLATGNQSPPTKSGGAQILWNGAKQGAKGDYEQFIDELPYAKWRAGLLASSAPVKPAAQPPQFNKGGLVVRMFSNGGPVKVPPPPAPASTPQQVAAALQQAGQYGGGSTVLTPQNASSVGLDPARGYVAQRAPAPQPIPVGSPPPGMAPGLGTVGGGPAQTPLPPSPSTQPDQGARFAGATKVENETPAASERFPGASKVDTPSEPSKPQEKFPGATRVDGGDTPTQALPQSQPQQPPPQAGPIPLEQEDAQTRVSNLIAQGKTPGEAQALVAGQQPKTVSGAEPKPTPSPQPKEPAPEQPPATQPADQSATAGHVPNEVSVRGTEFGEVDNPAHGGYTEPNWNKGAWGADLTGWNNHGAALPAHVLSQFGDWQHDPNFAKNFNGKYDIVIINPKTGKQTLAPLKDAGPGEGTGAGIDMLAGTRADLGFEANSSNSVRYAIVPKGTVAGVHFDAGMGSAGGEKGNQATSLNQPMFSVPIQSGGGASATQWPRLPQAESGGSPSRIAPPAQPPAAESTGILPGVAATALGATVLGRAPTPPAPQQTPEPEAPSSLMAQLIARGFTPDEALRYAQGLQNVAPGSGIGPLQAPSAPGGKGPLALPAPSAPPAPSLLQKQPEIAKGKVPAIVPGLGAADKKAVVKTLTGLGINKAHAQALVENAKGGTVDEVLGNALKAHGQGAIHGVGSASFRLAVGAPPAAPPAAQGAAKAPAPSQPGPAPKPALAQEPAGYAKPTGSTHGVANPPAFSALTPGRELSESVKEHAGLLSPDDPRVRKQADGTIKGEHFIAGDPIHDQLLEGLPEGKGGPQRQMLGEAEQAIAEKRPMHISYLSAPKEAQKFPTRESRTVQYEEHSPEARLMGSTTGQLVGHSFIPTAVGVSLPRKAGEPHQSYIQGISTNVLANNFEHLNQKLTSMGVETPYKTLGPKFFNDLEGYYSNLNAGHTGTGRGYAVGTKDLPSEPDTEHVPYKLARKEADFINTVINNTAAFAKHEDAGKLRELARANGTLITPEGETNRMRHQIEEHEPGWRSRVLEPTIRSFKTGLIVAHHKDEKYFPETIRPGKEFQELTRAIGRTSERGRPDVPVAISLHHTFADNRAINNIERDFSEHRIDEAGARKQLEDMGEDPGEYRFVGGSGGLITPYEDDPESITPEEHAQMKSNLRDQWVGGKLDVDKYRQKSAEVPLPSKPSKAAPSPKPPVTSEPEEPEAPAEAPEPKPIAPVPKPQPETPKEPPVEPQEEPEAPKESIAPAVKAKPQKPAAAPAPEAPPALGEAPKAAEPVVGKPPKFRPAKPEEFIAARDKSKRPQYLSPLHPDEIRNHKLFMTEDGKTGGAVSPEGDIQNVFNNGGAKGAGVHALVHAIEKHGGHTLDAFDPYLPELYSQFGFKETGRMKFNPEYAPPKWDHPKDDSPDVVFMGHSGYPPGGAEAALARSHEQDETKRIPYEPGRKYSDDWEAQKAASRLHTGGAGYHPGPGAGQEAGAERAGGAPSPGAGATHRPAVEEAPALGEPLPPAKAKSKEDQEKQIKELAMKQAAPDREAIDTPEDQRDQAASVRLNKVGKAWVKKNPDVHPQSMHAHLTGKRTFPGKLKNEQIGEYYDANNPKLDYANEEHREHVSDAVVHDIMHSLAGTTTGGKPSHAYGWYNRTIRKSLRKAAEIAPKILTDPAHALAFKLAWAITSQGQDVFPNTDSTWLAYRHFVKTGKLPESRELFKGAGKSVEAMEDNFKKINKLWHGDETGPGLGHEKLLKMLMKRMTVGELKKNYPGLDVGGELAHHTVNGAMMLGAKIGSFFSNLNGDFEPTTMDLWFSRNMNLMAGNMFAFSDSAAREDRIEKGVLVKSHLNQLREALDSGMLTNVDEDQAKKMSAELGALMQVPQGTLDRPTAKKLAPEIYNWAKERHNLYQRSPGVEGSYDESFKTPENLVAKKLDEATSKLSDAPRNGTERDWWRNIMERATDKLKAAGVRLTNADKQALLWFNIKDLFKMAGSPQRPKADYLDATYALVHKVKNGLLPGLEGGSQHFAVEPETGMSRREIRQKRDAIYQKLIDRTDSGPFDGGCVMMAQAIHKILGGDIHVLVDKDNVAQHAAVKKGNLYYDFSKSAPRDHFVKSFEKREGTKIRNVRPIEDADLPESPRDEKAAEEIANLMGNKFDHRLLTRD